MRKKRTLNLSTKIRDKQSRLHKTVGYESASYKEYRKSICPQLVQEFQFVRQLA